MNGTMTLFIGLDGSVRNHGANLEDPAVSLSDPKTWEDAGMTGGKSSAGVTVSQRTAMGYPPLWRAINLISGDVGRMPFAIYRRLSDGGKLVDTTHAAYRMCRRKANRFMRAKTFWQTITYHALIRGNGFAAIVRDRSGKPREQLLLDPDATYPVKLINEETDEAELWYLTYVGTQPIRLPARDVLHVKGLSHDGVCGIDVLTLMADALGLGIATRRWVSTFFANGTNISGVLMIPENYSPEKAEAVQKAWRKSSEGLSNSNKVALLKDGVKFLPLSSRPEEASAVGLMENEVLTASNITGVPPHKLGDKSRTSYNSLEIESQDYLDDCLDPWLVEIESEVNEKLLSEQEQESESHFSEFNRNARLRMDSAARSAFYEKLRQIGVLSVNDILRRESMPTIGPEGDLRFVPLNWGVLGADNSGSLDAKSAKRVKNSLRRLALDVLAKKTDIERERVAKASSREGFDAWSEEFYRDHAARLWDALRPICQAAGAIRGRYLSKRWKGAIRSHAAARLQAVRASKSIPETVASWSASDLCNVLLPEASTKGTLQCS